jgi:hypothetical protein
MLSSTEAVLRKHLQAAGVGVDAVMADYGDESVIITHDSTYRGLSEIRELFTELLDGAYRGFISALKMTRQEVVGEVAFILWDAPPWFRHASDTFVIRNGKILVQTFSALSANE